MISLTVKLVLSTFVSIRAMTSALLIGAPGVFFFIVFQPALQNTKGRMVGYKDHKTYGDSSIYENTPSNNEKFYLTLNS